MKKAELTLMSFFDESGVQRLEIVVGHLIEFEHSSCVVSLLQTEV